MFLLLCLFLFFRLGNYNLSQKLVFGLFVFMWLSPVLIIRIRIPAPHLELRRPRVPAYWYFYDYYYYYY